MFLSDFHLHSTFSDGKLSIPEIVDLYGARGFGAIAITDHLCEDETLIGKAAAYLGRTLTPATFPIYQEILKSEANRAWRKYRMLVLPGFELTRNSISNHRSAHVLAIGCEDWISASLPIEEQCAAIHHQGGLAVAAHPVPTGEMEKQTLYLWKRREELSKHFDAWEVASGRKLFSEVLESGLPMLANSDLHRREQFESWKTLLYCEKDKDAIREAVRTQNIRLKYVLDTGGEDEPVSEFTDERLMDRLYGGLDLRFRRPAFGSGAFPLPL